MRKILPVLNRWSRAFVCVCAVVPVFAGSAVFAEEQNLKDGAQRAGHALGAAARDIGQGAKKIGKEIGHGAKEAGQAIGEAAKEGGKEFRKGRITRSSLLRYKRWRVDFSRRQESLAAFVFSQIRIHGVSMSKNSKAKAAAKSVPVCGVGGEGLKCAVVSWLAPLAAVLLLVAGMYYPVVSAFNILFVAFGITALARSVAHIRKFGSCGLGGHVAVGALLNLIIATLIVIYIFTSFDPIHIRP